MLAGDQPRRVHTMARPFLTCATLLVLALGWTALFLTCELVTAHKSLLWAGLQGANWPSYGVGGVAYALAIFVSCVLFQTYVHCVLFGPVPLGSFPPLCRVSPDDHRQKAVGLLVSSAFCASAVWVTVAATGALLLSRGTLLALLLLALWTSCGCLLIRGGSSALRFGVLLFAACAAAIGATIAAGHLAFFSEYYEPILEATPFIWMFLSAILLLPVRPVRPFWLARAAFMVLAPLICVYLGPIELPAKRDGSNRSNMVLITCDALRADWCSPYGGPVPTPALRHLADEGVRFAQSYSLAPWTLPSLHGLFASDYPRGLTPGASKDKQAGEIARYRLPSETRTLVQELEKAGYATGAFVGNELLRDRHDLLRGFRSTAYCLQIPASKVVFDGCPRLNAAVCKMFPGPFEVRPPDTTRFLTLRSLAFLRRYKDRPFFLWVHYFNPHDPYDPPDRYRTLKGPWPVFGPYFPEYKWKDFDSEGRVLVDDKHRPYIKSLYTGSVRYVDEAIGQVLGELKALHIDKNTYVCLSADHGEELWDNGNWGHGFTLFEPQIRVPLIFAGPDIVPGVVETPVSALDVMPTLGDLLRLDRIPTWKGDSLTPALRGHHIEPRPIFVAATDQAVEPLQAVVWQGYKLIEGLASGSRSLYDLTKGEGIPLKLDMEPERLRTLEALLSEWRKTHKTEFDSGDTESRPEESELQESLRNLGYL